MLAFIHVAKTGGQTIETLLESSFGVRHMPAVLRPGAGTERADDADYVIPKYTPEDFRRLKRLCPFLRSVGGHGIALWSDLQEVEPTRYWALVREPLRRGASHFQYHVGHDQPDLEWRKWVSWPVHHNHQLKMFSPRADAHEAVTAIEKNEVFVGLTEHFDESLLVFKRLFAPDLNITYRRTNTARDNRLAQQLLQDPDSRLQLEEMYGDEVPFYEWVAREYYPRFREAYGPGLARDLEEFRRHRDRVNRLNIRLSRLYFRLVVRPRLRSA